MPFLTDSTARPSLVEYSWMDFSFWNNLIGFEFFIKILADIVGAELPLPVASRVDVWMFLPLAF